MPQRAARAVCAPCSLFRKVGLPSEASANLCRVRKRVGAGRHGTAAVAGGLPGSPDVAGVSRSHFGAFPPAPRAPEVRLVVAGVGRLHFGALSPARRASEVLPDVAGACKLHLGAFSPAPRAPQVPLDLFLTIIIGSFLVLDRVTRYIRRIGH